MGHREMQEVVVTTWCDYPGCVDEYRARVKINSQETYPVSFWVYPHAKGKPTQPIVIELCEAHRDDMKALFVAMKPFDQSRDI